MQDSTYDIFKQIGDLSTDVYSIYNLGSGKYEYVSPSIKTVFGVSIEAMINDPHILLKNVHEEDIEYLKEHLQQLPTAVTESTVDIRIYDAEKQEKCISLTTYPIASAESGPYVAGIARDITIERSNTMYAEKINARKNTMLTVLAHDLKGPTGIMGMMAGSISNIARSSGNEQILSASQVIQELCQRNIDLIKDLLDREFLESPEVKLRKERIDLIKAINNMMIQYQKSTTVVVKTFIFNHSAENLYVYVDTLKLIQVLNNLVSNAIKFTRTNGVIELTVTDQPTTVLITVKDNGIGIPADMQPYLFDKFTPARRKGLLGEETTGLGMFIIQRLVELHNGRIWFESEENKGCTFYLEIPK